MTVTVSDSHRRWLEEQAARFNSTVDRVVAELIEDACESAEAEAKVLEAVSGAPAVPMTAADWGQLRDRITRRQAADGTD